MVDTQEFKKIRIVDFCNRNGIAIKQDSKEYYRLIEHDSLVINDRKNLFIWNSHNKGGDIIDFVQEYYNCNFLEAKHKLMDIDYNPHEIKRNKFKGDKSKPESKELYKYDFSKERKVNVARDYLVQKRKINPQLVDNLIQKGLIRQDNRNNALFIWSDSKKIVGCSEQGTRVFYDTEKDKFKTWKKIQPNGKEDYGFNFKVGNGENFFFFESEIDMLSYLSLNPKRCEDSHFISMNGLKKETVLNFVNEWYKEKGTIPKSINICVDNDKGGWKFYNNQFKGQILREKGTDNYVEIKSDIPNKEGYDWNDMLIERTTKRFKGISEEQLGKILGKHRQIPVISRDFEMEL
ncbi:DUF3991 and TOPRIM domain-containing protein [Clostridium sporogenes]|uniref:DUF3991 and TOPRIM domain-containing protein n=1 Tax=Clostridium sporogenes TaxID=1509 RepID=UPI00072A9CE6|nr:DUF3991 and TOPRIM domain-containing protein [Clostridium sporogenes]KRU40010.1 toprim-like protein [Clostridium sporogenes]MBY7065173.1 DUF3991 domain-containing protein [Clostridium sporogenes]MBY7071857.1 DUF3991 domain-containing protein [Clostridium sporogenes]MCW6064757.1 DUF3991 and toprim domain-containing protein [Clostridium sporogenes]OQP88516.1 toprim-like protein [Clostridium sporogenes]